VKLILGILMCILSEVSFAQYTFRYEYDSIRTLPTSFVEVEDGFVIAGAKHPNQGDYNIHLYNSHLIKINNKGEYQWTKELKDSLFNNIFDIDFDNNYLYAVELANIEIDRSKTYFLKFDTHGSLLNRKEIGSISNTSRDNLPSDIIVRQDGNILLSNSEFNFSNGNTECVIYCLDKDGNILTRTAFSQDTLSCIPYDLIKTTDNGFAVVMSALNLNTLYEKVFLLKFDSIGNEMWRTQINTSDPIQTDFSLCELNNTLYCAMATSYTNGGPARLTIVKYDDNGNQLFEKNYANNSSSEPESFDFPRISLNKDSTSLLIYGSFAGSQTVFNPRLLFADLNGNIYNSIDVPYQHELGNGWSIDLKPSDDGGITLLNRNFSYIPQASNYTELLKLDCEGNFEWKDKCSFINSDSDVIIFPNPSNNFFNFQLENIAENSNIELIIYDNVGNLVFKTSSYSRCFTVDLTNISIGVYQFKLRINEIDYFTGKLVRN
jgi:hypothetical protein